MGQDQFAIVARNGVTPICTYYIACEETQYITVRPDVG